nr:MAG TPA: holin [Caudoviricetes sp.]
MDDKTYFLPSKAYEWLKWLGLIAIPAIATFTGVIGAVWGWHDTDAIVTTLNAVGVLIGSLIGISHATVKTDGPTE